MATKKKEAGGLTEQDLAEVGELERKIDEAIREKYERDDYGVKLQVKQLPRKRVERELAKRYREAGWTITFTSDQRDGDYISLK